MAMMFDLTGQQMGDYRLVRFLGAGAFASVYLGENVHLPSFKVAVKVLHLFNVDQTLFRHEAETMVSLAAHYPPRREARKHPAGPLRRSAAR